MHILKVLPRGQITLPREIKNTLGIKEGDIMIIEKTEEGIMLKKGKTIHDYISVLPKPDIPLEEVVERSIEKAVKERA